MQKSKIAGKLQHKFDGTYFFFKDEILPVYRGNIDKIGLLDPNVAQMVVVTSSLIVSAIRQIELVGEKNLKIETINIDEAEYITFLAREIGRAHV